VLREAFAQPGPAVIEAVVDANEPPLPGRIKTQEAVRFAEALLKGQPDKWAIVSNAMKDVIGQKVREVV
jgi:pyruvate dehydrogenase (quinone)